MTPRLDALTRLSGVSVHPVGNNVYSGTEGPIIAKKSVPPITSYSENYNSGRGEVYDSIQNGGFDSGRQIARKTDRASLTE